MKFFTDPPDWLQELVLAVIIIGAVVAVILHYLEALS